MRLRRPLPAVQGDTIHIVGVGDNRIGKVATSRPNRNCNIAGIGISTHIPLTRLQQDSTDYFLFPSFASLISTALPPVLQKSPPVLQKNGKVQKPLIKSDNFSILVGSSLQSPCIEAEIAQIPCSHKTHPCIALAETARREPRQWPEMLPRSGAPELRLTAKQALFPAAWPRHAMKRLLRRGRWLCNQSPANSSLRSIPCLTGKIQGNFRHCQTKANRYPKVVMHPPSGRKLAPLGQGSGAVLLEDVAAVEVAILVEVVVKRGMDGSELLKGLHVPELRHRPLSSPQRLMRIFGPVVEPATALLSGSITDHVHRRTV